MAGRLFGHYEKGSQNQSSDEPGTVSGAFTGFGRPVDSLGSAMTVFSKGVQGFASAIEQGYQSGGLGGAIGGGLSQVGSVLGSFKGLGPAGAIIGGIGSIFSTISDIFQAAAQHMAQVIQRQIQNITEAYSTGQATLTTTIQQLESERTQAIESLSGMKGGQKQHDQLLPALNQQIAELQQQQLQIKQSFDASLQSLSLQSQTLSDFVDKWQQINTQVQQYLNAGGDVAKAQQMLSQSLQQVLTTDQQTLQQNQSSAVQDALQLNQLLQQRVQLEQQFAQQEFALKNADSVERANSPALNAALSYQQQKQQDLSQLQDLDSQINLMQAGVNMESQVFSIAKSTADLQTQSNILNIEQLATQLQQYKSMQAVVSSIYQNPDGTYGTSLASSVDVNNPGVTPFSTTVNNPSQLAKLSDQIAQQIGQSFSGSGPGSTGNPSGFNGSAQSVQQLAALIASQMGTATPGYSQYAEQIAQSIEEANSSTALPLAPTSTLGTPNPYGFFGGSPSGGSVNVASLTPGTPGYGQPSGALSIGAINVNVAGTNASGTDIANAIVQELRTQGRYGSDTSYT